jgi:hypothetical protein
VTSLFSFISPFGFSNTMTPWRCIQKQTDGKPSLSAKKRGTEKTLKLVETLSLMEDRRASLQLPVQESISAIHLDAAGPKVNFLSGNTDKRDVVRCP